MSTRRRLAQSLNTSFAWTAKAIILAAIAALGGTAGARSEGVTPTPGDGHIPLPEQCGFVVDEGDLTYNQVGIVEGDSHVPPFCQA